MLSPLVATRARLAKDAAINAMAFFGDIDVDNVSLQLERN